MARPITHLEELSKLAEDIKPKETRSIIDITVDTLRNKPTKYLLLGTITARSGPPSEDPKPAVIQKPEPLKLEEPFDKPFLPSKPVPHPPKISPSSIPNPNPSVTANKEGYPNYAGFLYNIPGYSAFQPVNYSHQTNQPPPTPMQTETSISEFKPFTITGTREVKEPEEKAFDRKDKVLERREEKEGVEKKERNTPKQQDFEDNFTMKIIPSTSKPDASKTQLVESKMSITSLTQGSGGSVTIPTKPNNKDVKKKPEKYSLKTSIPISKIDMKCVSSPVDTAFQNAIKKPVFSTFQKEIERPKVEIQSNIVIKTATGNKETEEKDTHLMPDRESLRNVKPSIPPVVQNNSISTLINAAEAINKNDSQFRVPEPKADVPKEAKDSPGTQPALHRPKPKDISPAVTQPSAIQRPMFDSESKEASKLNSVQSSVATRPMFNPISAETCKPNLAQRTVPTKPIFHPISAESSMQNLTQPSTTTKPMFNPGSAESNQQNFPNKPPDGGYNEQKKLMFLNQKNQNPKMLLTIQPNPHVLLQRTNFESKNLQAPSRLSSQSKKSSEVNADTSSKVVALKRLHHDDCDENDFENLITENQIYGNKIVVKEKSQVTQEEWKNKVKVEKQTEQDWKNKIKIDLKVDKTAPESKNVVLQPNFVYLSNLQFPGNLMMIKNNTKICQTTDSNKIKVSPNENRSEVTINNNNVETNTVIKNPKLQNVTINKEIHVLKSSNNVLQTLSNNNNKTDVVFQTNQKIIVTPQVVYQVPIVVTEDSKNHTVKEVKVTPMMQKKELPKEDAKSDKVIITCQVEKKVPKIIIANLRPKVTTNTTVLEEVSMLDNYENKKRLRRLKYLSNNKDIAKTESSSNVKKIVSKAAINVITPDKMKAEIFKEFLQTKGKKKERSSDSESDCENELDEYNDIIEKYGVNYNENAKADFLAGFSLASREVFREKQLERHERTLKFDAIASAYMAAGRLDPLKEQPDATPEPETPRTAPAAENKWTMQRKHLFLSHFKLIQVSPSFKADYEKSWREILRERNRRNGIPNSPEPFDPDGQLQMLTEINKSVNENNDLIKKRLDSICDENSDIRILAEKNFSELNRLSKMAGRSVKLFSGKDTKKRDLNPGFDSENIKKTKFNPKDYPRLNIPNIYKIISLKTDQEASSISTSQATSMDEPLNSASCGEVTKEVGCQADERVPWQRATDIMDNFIKNYREYEIARKKEMDELHRSNTRLRVECAHVTRSASRDSDRARALLAERQHLAGEEISLRTSLERLSRAIEVIRKP